MKIRLIDIENIYVGSLSASQMFLGDQKVWPTEEPAEYWGLKFTAAQAGSVVSMAAVGSPQASLDLLYSTDGIRWQEFTPYTTSVSLPEIGDYVFIKAGANGNQTINSSNTDYYKFTIAGTVGASGSLMSLLDGDVHSSAAESMSCCFAMLFRDCSSLTSAPQCDATSIGEGCYRGTFYNCVSLLEAPELPALSVPQDAYRGMFVGCSSLSSSPALSAVSVGNGAYQAMFQKCYSLVDIPAVSAAVLGDNACRQMFDACSSLTSSPEFAPLSVGSNSCRSMFQNCYQLVDAPELPATTLADSCYYWMFNNCRSLTSAPTVLPATSTSVSCYALMFQNCSFLTAGPAISATSLGHSCCRGMFNGCTSLASLSVDFTTFTQSTNTFMNWVQNVSSNGTFYCPTALGTNETITRGISNCPTNWTVVNTDA